VLSHDTFKDQDEALNLVVLGQVLIQPDVTAQDIQQGLEELSASGAILCPAPLVSALRPKLRHADGALHAYDPGAKLITGSLDLHEHYLHALDDAAELLVIGKLKAKQILPNDLLEQKISKIQVDGSVVCREENVATLMSRLASAPKSPKMQVIPAGFELVERALVLDSGTLQVLPSDKLYCTETVRIAEDVELDALDQALQALEVKDMLVCPAALRSVMAKKLNVLETEAVFYTGQLWLVDDESTLSASRFEHLEGQASLVVTGQLNIAPDVEAQTLSDRLGEVYNYGLIEGTNAQLMALHARLKVNQGELSDQQKKDLDQEKGYMFNNAVYLKL
jgi:hypothetical protein